MRRSLPILLVAGLIVLAVGAAALSVSSSPRIVYFSTPPSGNSQVLASFRALVKNTLNQRSFTLHSTFGEMVYQAPDRSEYQDGGILSDTIIVVGDSSFTALASSHGHVTQWGEYPVTALVRSLAAPSAAKGELESLLTAQSVVQVGDAYLVKEVGPAEFEQADDVLIEITVHAANGHVSSVRLVGFGAPALGTGILRFSRFNSSPAVNPPPRDLTVQLVPCKDGSTFDSGSGPAGYICGLMGYGPP